MLKTASYHFWTVPLIHDDRGNLCVIEHSSLPFIPKRSYFLFKVTQKRGAHAHLKEKEVFVCLSGSFTARIHDGKRWRTFKMNRPGHALYTDAKIWHEFDHFSPDGIMLAISSTPYKGTKEYILDFDIFKKLWRKKS